MNIQDMLSSHQCRNLDMLTFYTRDLQSYESIPAQHIPGVLPEPPEHEEVDDRVVGGG